MMETSKDTDTNPAPDTGTSSETATGAEQPDAAPAPEKPGETADNAAPDAATNDNASGWSGGAAAARVAELEAENADVKDRLLRLAAEMENLRRRTQKEISDARQFAISGFARDVLTIGDNLRRAVEAVPEEQRADADSGMKALVEGVEMTEREFTNVLGRHNVSTIDPVGEKFDPNAHEAVFQVPDPSMPTGTVSQVVQVGYRIGERVLRPAMVGVSAGGPKTAPAAPETQAEVSAAPETADDGSPATTPDPEPDSGGPGATVDKTA